MIEGMLDDEFSAFRSLWKEAYKLGYEHGYKDGKRRKKFCVEPVEPIESLCNYADVKGMTIEIKKENWPLRRSKL